MPVNQRLVGLTRRSYLPLQLGLLAARAGQIVGQIGPSQVGPGTYDINISGNAATATLAGGLSNTTPMQCSAGQVAIGVTNTGNAVCINVDAANLSGILGIANGGT